MRVLLVRHAEASEPRTVPSDGHRYLTPKGRETMRRVAAALSEGGVRFDRIFTSPLVRAAQTAEILAAQDVFAGPLEVWPALANGTTAQALMALERAAEEETVALVGHEPSIHTMAAHLAGFASFPGFRTGSVCAIDVRDGQGGFQWILDPRTLQRYETIDGLEP